MLVQLKSSQIVFYVDETFRNNRGSSYLRWFELTLSEFCFNSVTQLFMCVLHTLFTLMQF